MAAKTHLPQPQRVVVGNISQLKRGEITPRTRQLLREAVLRHRPWQYATGPKTAEGKARSARNGKWRQKGLLSRRELERELTEMDLVLTDLAATRHRIGKQAIEPE